jgi:mRNA-degrading endonuclease RelE of RelBE toxin-antitoxin system
MKSRKTSPTRNAKRPQARKRTRSPLFSLLVIASIAAVVSAGNLLPVRSFLTSAQGGGNGDNQPGSSGQGAENMSERARQQIESLMNEKATRSNGRKKMDSRLIYGLKKHRRERITDEVESLEVQLPLNSRGEVIVDITATVDNQLLNKLRSAGVRVISSFAEYHSIRASLSLDAMDTIADFPEIKFIQPMQEAITQQEEAAQSVDPEHLSTTNLVSPDYESNISEQLMNALEEFQANAYSLGQGGVRKSQADVTHRAAAARNTYGFDGSGVKIGVLSDGVRNLAAAVASGDTGPVTVLPGQSGTAQCAATSACDEGTAMLELIHDLAPGAQLYFATALGGSANFANNIRNLRTAGCDIIVDDVFYFAESPFQDGQAPGIISPTNGGVVTQAVNDVTASGALYFSSAGNSGNKTDGTSGVWEGDFVDGGNVPAIIAAAGGAGRVHQFPGGATFNTVTAAGSSQYNLNWSDPLGGSANDYDLFMLNAAGTAVLTASTGNQSGTQDPFEAVGIPTSGGVPVANVRLVIVKFSGVGRYLRLTTNRGRLSVNTPGQTTGHSTALNAFGVAATPAATAFGAAPNPVGPFPNAFNSTNQTELFSSDGPRKIFYKADGTPYTPGDVSSTGGISRQKPDITAADGASVTGAGGFGITFFGTSAAAPDAAAIAALLKSANPALTPAQVRDALQNSAIDIETPGVDRDTGYGIVMADAALNYIGATPAAAYITPGTVTVSETGGNGNGFVEPGERGTLSMPLLNSGVAQALNVTATISSATPGVIVTPSATRSFPDIAMTNGSSSSATPYEFVYQQTAVYAANIDFVLTVNYNGTTRSYPITVPTGQLANISSVLDTTAPVVPVGANYTAATGLQTSRMNFTFPISACGTTKANPGAAVSALTRRYDAYSFTNTSAAPICVTVNLAHSSSVLMYVDAYIPTFVPATVATNFAGDNGGSATSGAGTTQLFSFTVPANQTFTVVVSESNSGGAPNTPYNLRVTGLPAAAVPANVAPVNTVPGAQSVLEDGALVFDGSNPISIADTDAGNNPVEVTLAATSGVVSLNGINGLSFTSGDGAGDATMTFTGSISDINSALNGLSYGPAADFNGPASLNITTSDKGNTGTGAAGSDTDAVTINVTPVNDVPSFTAGANQGAAEDAGAQSVPNWATNLSAGPADEAGQSLSFVVNNDNNSLFSVQPAVAPDGTLTYTPALNSNGSANVTVVIKDNGGTDNGGIDTSAPQSFTINVTAVDDAPVFTSVPTDVTIPEVSPYTFTATASDVDGPALTFSLVGAPAGASINPTTGQFNWTPTEAQGGTGVPFVFKVKVSDGTESAESDIQITVTEVNQNPVLAAIGDKTALLGSTLTFTATATDDDLPAQTLGYSLTGAVPAGASINPTTGQFNWTPSVGQVGAIYTFKVRVTDSLLGFDDEQISVGVGYTWTGLLAPMQEGGVYKIGRTLPLKFSLTGASAPLTNAVARLYIAKISNGVAGIETDADSTSAATTGNLFRYAGDGQYIFNWSVQGYTPGTYQLRIDMGDGVQRIVIIGLN